MTIEVSASELHERTADLLRRVQAGDHVRITDGGQTIAEITPLTGPPMWVPREQLVEILKYQADPGLRDDLREFWDSFGGG